MAVTGLAVGEVVVSWLASVAVLALKALQTPAVARVPVTLAPHTAPGVTSAPLTPSVRVIAPGPRHTALTGPALSQAGTHTSPRVRVTHVTRLRAGGALPTSGVGDAPVAQQTGGAPGPAHPRPALALTSHIVTVAVHGAHGVAVTLGAASTRGDPPVLILTLVTPASLHFW